MTRECQFCGKSFGEKCPKCGAPAVTLEGVIYFCIGEKCEHLFLVGEGGNTSGVCPDCGPILEQQLIAVIDVLQIRATKTEAK